MSIASMMLGLLGGMFGLLIGLFGYSVLAVGGMANAGPAQFLAMAIPIASFVGGGMARTNPLAAGVLMLASAILMVTSFGMNAFTAVPFVLSGLGGALALIVAQSEATRARSSAKHSAQSAVPLVRDDTRPSVSHADEGTEAEPISPAGIAEAVAGEKGKDYPVAEVLPPLSPAYGKDDTFRYAVLGVSAFVALSAITVGGVLGWKYLESKVALSERARVGSREGLREAQEAPGLGRSTAPPAESAVASPEPPPHANEEVKEVPTKTEPGSVPASPSTEVSGSVTERAVPSVPVLDPAPAAPSYAPAAPTYSPPVQAYESPTHPSMSSGSVINKASLWNHNGSTMVLVANGDRRQFYYHSPRAGMRAVGIQNGTLLVDGRRKGNAYSGVAYVFSHGCGSFGFNVTGVIINGDREVLLHGRAPRTQNCAVVDYIDSSLRFTYERVVQPYIFGEEGD